MRIFINNAIKTESFLFFLKMTNIENFEWVILRLCSKEAQALFEREGGGGGVSEILSFPKMLGEWEGGVFRKMLHTLIKLFISISVGAYRLLVKFSHNFSYNY